MINTIWIGCGWRDGPDRDVCLCLLQISIDRKADPDLPLPGEEHADLSEAWIRAGVRRLAEQTVVPPGMAERIRQRIAARCGYPIKDKKQREDEAHQRSG